MSKYQTVEFEARARNVKAEVCKQFPEGDLDPDTQVKVSINWEKTDNTPTKWDHFRDVRKKVQPRLRVLAKNVYMDRDVDLNYVVAEAIDGTTLATASHKDPRAALEDWYRLIEILDLCVMREEDEHAED